MRPQMHVQRRRAGCGGVGKDLQRCELRGDVCRAAGQVHGRHSPAISEGEHHQWPGRVHCEFNGRVGVP